MRNVDFRPRAEADLDGILVYLAFELGAPQAAQSFTEELFHEFELVADVSEIGRKIVDPALGRAYRKIMVKTYWVFYSYDEETLTVWRIISTLRDLDHYGFEADF